MLDQNELKTIGISTGLILLNVILMALMASKQASQFMDLAFRVPIVGVLVFGTLITGGVYIAKEGVKKHSRNQALGGTVILQIAYAIFGAGIIGFLPKSSHAIILMITGIVTAIISVLSGLTVYLTDHDFRNWGKYSSYMFLGVIGLSLLGSFTPIVLAGAFLLALAGFITYLIHEIWRMKSSSSEVYLNSIGIYVAFMGVFVQILQIIVEMYLRR